MWYNKNVVKIKGGIEMAENNVVDMSDFAQRRDGFMRKIKIKPEKAKKKGEKGEIQVFDIDRSPIKIQDYKPDIGRKVTTKMQEYGEKEVTPQTQEEKEQKKPAKKKEYKAKKSAKRGSNEKQRKETRKRLARKVRTIAAIAVSTISIGGVAGGVMGEKLYNELEERRDTVTLEQALEAGKKLEDFSLQEDDIKKLKDMNETIEKDDITYKELYEIAQEIPGLRQLFLKEKMVEAFKTPEDDNFDWKMNPAGIGMPKQLIVDDIEFEIDPSGKGICIEIQGKGTYRSEKVSDYKTFSSDIQEYIDEIKEEQEMREAMEGKNVTIEEAKEFYEKAIEKVNQQATWTIEITQEGNLEVEKMKQSELERDDEWER